MFSVERKLSPRCFSGEKLCSSDDLGGQGVTLAYHQHKVVNMRDELQVDFEAVDFDTAVDEVDVLVPKYLQALQDLEVAEHFSDMLVQLKNVRTYWNRLDLLLKQMAPLELDIPVAQILKDTLQSELGVLEQLYLSINLRIEFAPTRWTGEMWEAADAVLDRMEEVLEELGFDETHQDRMLIAELQEKNIQLREKKSKR